MKDKIVDIEGKKFLMNFSDNSFLEIVDYNEPKINTLTAFSYIDTEETKSYFGDINYGKEKKKWGCINERNEVVIPCVYDNIDVCNNTFTDIKGLKRFDFDAEGIPIYKYRINGIEKTTRFIGWQYVERFDDKPISIGAKNGKIGIVKIDGSSFLPPEYDSICIDWSKKCITTKKAGVTTQILYFEQKKKCWSPIPSEFSFYKEQLDLYILKRNDLFAGMDKAQMAESVDALVSTTSGETRPGSTPGLGTQERQGSPRDSSLPLSVYPHPAHPPPTAPKGGQVTEDFVCQFKAMLGKLFNVGNSRNMFFKQQFSFIVLFANPNSIVISESPKTRRTYSVCNNT